jgi:hypothetical protein
VRGRSQQLAAQGCERLLDAEVLAAVLYTGPTFVK